MKDYKKLGYIYQTHGLKGEVKMIVTTTNIDKRFYPGAKAFVEVKGQLLKLNVASFRFQKGDSALITFKQIHSIDEAQQILKHDLLGEKLEDGTIYLQDLIGFEVLSKDNTSFGQVTDYQIFTNKPYLQIDKVYLPYIDDIFIQSIDKDKKVIYLTEQGEDIFHNA